MRLTPLDIRKQEFSRGFRGFDADEVNAFLQMVANQWEELQDENRRREERIRELEGKLVHYEKVEEALQEALQTARETSRKALENAEEKAAIMIDQAEARAEEIKRDAERERHDLKRETVKLSGRRSEIVSRLRAFLMSEMELLARYEGDDPVGFIKLLPAEEKRLRRLSDRLAEGDKDAAAGTHHEPPTSGAGREAPARREREEGGSEPEPTSGGSVTPPTFTPRPSEPSEWAPRSVDEQSEGSRRVEEEGVSKPHPREEDAHEATYEAQPAEPQRVGDEAPAEPAQNDDDVSPIHEQEGEDVREGPGWTARTVVSRPSEQPEGWSEPPPRDGGSDEREKEEETDMRASSEEIEKIRRILSDLD